MNVFGSRWDPPLLPSSSLCSSAFASTSATESVLLSSAVPQASQGSVNYRLNDSTLLKRGTDNIRHALNKDLGFTVLPMRMGLKTSDELLKLRS